MKRLIIIAALCSASPAEGREVANDDGKEILSLCESSYDFSKGMCLGYVRGIATTTDILMQMNDRHLCFPKSVTVGQMRDVVIAYIRRNPAQRHEGATLLYMRAINEAWPCK